jgi:aminoglycoside 6'-N-acetyltransferase I
MSETAIYKAAADDLETVTALLNKLYKHSSYRELLQENELLISSATDAIFFANTYEAPVGVAHVSIRTDCVSGTNSGNVGFLEGVYVEPKHRKNGIAKQLVAICENWAVGKGCREFASDCMLDNTDSYKFHIAIGFREAQRLICFVKDIGAK